MSRSFVAASSQLLEVSNPPLLAVPMSWACWFKRAAVTPNMELLWLGKGPNTNNYWTMGLVVGAMRSSARNVNETPALTTIDAPAGVWCHGCGTYPSDNQRFAYLNGANRGVNNTLAAPNGATRFAVGSLDRSVPTNFFEGLIAQVSIWDVALSDAEVALLASGVPASQVQPQALVAYYPNLGQNSPEIDVIGGRNLTVINGALSSSDEPPMILPDSGAGRTRRRRRLQVEIDGQIFDVESAEHAQALLDQAKTLARQLASRKAEVKLTAHLSRTPKQRPKIERPQIVSSNPELQTVIREARATLARIYSDAYRDAEIKLRLAAKFGEDDEDDVDVIAMM